MKRFLQGLVVLSVIYSGVWYYCANEGRQQLVHDLNMLKEDLIKDGQYTRNLSHGRIGLSGFPFRFNYQIDGVKLSTSGGELICEDVVQVGVPVIGTSITAFTEGDVFITTHASANSAGVEQLSKIEGFRLHTRLRKMDGSQAFLLSTDTLKDLEKLRSLMRVGQVHLGPSWFVVWTADTSKQYMLKWQSWDAKFDLGIINDETAQGKLDLAVLGIGLQVAGAELSAAQLLKEAVMETGKGTDAHISTRFKLDYNPDYSTDTSAELERIAAYNIVYDLRVEGNPLYASVGSGEMIHTQEEGELSTDLRFRMEDVYPEGMDSYLAAFSTALGVPEAKDTYPALRDVQDLGIGVDWRVSGKRDGMILSDAKVECRELRLSSNLGGISAMGTAFCPEFNMGSGYPASDSDVVIDARFELSKYRPYLLHLLEIGQAISGSQIPDGQSLESFASLGARFLEAIAEKHEADAEDLFITCGLKNDRLEVGGLGLEHLLFTWMGIAAEFDAENKI